MREAELIKVYILEIEAHCRDVEYQAAEIRRRVRTLELDALTGGDCEVIETELRKIRKSLQQGA